MRKLFIVLFILFTCVWCFNTYTQEISTQPVVTIEATNTPTVIESVTASIEDLPGAVDQVKHQLDERSSNKVSMVITIAAILSVILKFLITILRRFSLYLDNNKTLLRVIPLVFGILALCFDKLVLGGAWWESIMAGLSGPGAIMVNELLQIATSNKLKA